jgi:hypothetical protein
MAPVMSTPSVVSVEGDVRVVAGAESGKAG